MHASHKQQRVFPSHLLQIRKPVSHPQTGRYLLFKVFRLKSQRRTLYFQIKEEDHWSGLLFPLYCDSRSAVNFWVWVQVLLPVSTTLCNHKSTNCTQRSSIILCGFCFSSHSLSLNIILLRWPFTAEWAQALHSTTKLIQLYNNLFVIPARTLTALNFNGETESFAFIGVGQQIQLWDSAKSPPPCHLPSSQALSSSVFSFN